MGKCDRRWRGVHRGMNIIVEETQGSDARAVRTREEGNIGWKRCGVGAGG